MAAGAKVCPRGHDLSGGAAGKAADDGEPSTIDIDMNRVVDAGAAPRPPPSRPSTLFECDPCGRLVEMQEHEGRVVVPAFCPWCGKAVEPIVGREIDGYEVGDLLAQGGFGLVYLASNVAEPKMKAVIKFLRPRMGYLHPELTRIFVEEARLTEEIGQTCWNVVRVSNVRERPWPYFFMEYIRGTTLDQVLRTVKDKRIPIDDAKGYLRGIAKALAATHAHGRVHRDLKPLNIMVIQSQEIRAEERVKLLDFGLSMKIARGRTSFEGATSALDDGTAAGHSPVQSAGTPEYMPPEAFDGLNEFAGDIYSFGVTAYEILTGETPWTQPPDGSQRFFYWRDTHKKSPPRAIRDVRPDVPGWLAGVVMKCLEKDPNQRIRTADELISRLREPMPRWLWAAAGAAGILFGVLLWFALRGGGEVRDALWTVGDETSRKEHRLWVKEPADLAGVKATLKASGDGQILEASASSPDVRLRVDKGIVEVEFPGGPGLASLIGTSIAIEGRGSDFRVEGTLEVGQDRAPPVFVDLGFGELGIIETSRSPLEVLPLPAAKRFHSQRVALAVSVEEENVREPLLNFHTLQDTPLVKSIRGELEAIAGRAVWTFSLANLPPGDYTAGVEAADRAGNKDFIPNFEFKVDDAAQITLISSDRPRFIAAGRAWYEIDAVEPLARVEVRGKAVKGWAIHEIKAVTALDVARRAQAAPVSVKPEALEKLKRYLLAVAVEGEGAEAGTFDLVATDTATPPNEGTWKLPFTPPARLENADVTCITLEFEDETASLQVRPQEDFKLPAPARFTRVKRLRADFKKERIHAMEVALGGTAVSGNVDIDDRSAVLEGLDLVGSANSASTENNLLLRFLDPLERPLEVTLSIFTDLVPPTITPHARSGGDVDPKDHRVDSWDKVELWVEASEPLSEAVCRIQGQDLPGTIDRSSKPKVARFDTSGLDPREGAHRFEVEAIDLAGHASVKRGSVDLNRGPPDIKPTPKEISPRVLALTETDFSFEVRDENKPLDHRDATVTFDYGGKAPAVVKIAPPRDQASRIHSVSLPKILPENATGTLTIRIADKFGLWAEDEWGFSFTRPRENWKPLVKGWRGLDWVFVPAPDGKDLYISRTEVPNSVYLELRRKGLVARPKYWGDGDELPTYHTPDGESRDGGPFPVVGIPLEEAKKAAQALGGSLPTDEQWLKAAWKQNQGGKYPWREDEAARDYVNCYGTRDLEGSPFHDHHYKDKMKDGNGKEIVCQAVEADFDPWGSCPEKVRDRLKYSGEILHLIGNVREFVLMRGGYGIVGGSYLSEYERISLRDEIEPVDKLPDAETGFRVVIPLATASENFKKVARRK